MRERERETVQVISRCFEQREGAHEHIPFVVNTCTQL